MAKKLTLVRHAKSSWKFDTPDFYRPLNRRGLADAATMAKTDISFPPDVILCSPAVRAYATAAAYLRENRWPGDLLVLVPEFYECDEYTLLQAIARVSDVVTRLWIVAHNPGLQLLAEYLQQAVPENMVTAARLTFSVPVEQWSDITRVAGLSEVLNYCIPAHFSDMPSGAPHTQR